MKLDLRVLYEPRNQYLMIDFIPSISHGLDTDQLINPSTRLIRSRVLYDASPFLSQTQLANLFLLSVSLTVLKESASAATSLTQYRDTIIRGTFIFAQINPSPFDLLFLLVEQPAEDY